MAFFRKKTDLTKMTTDELNAALVKLELKGKTFSENLGRFASGALAFSGGFWFLATMGVTGSILMAAPVFSLYAAALLASSAATGLSLHSFITNTPEKIKQKNKQDILIELGRRRPVAAPKAEKHAAVNKFEKIIEQKQTAAPVLPVAEPDRLGQVLAAATQALEKAATVNTDKKTETEKRISPHQAEELEIKSLHVREFGAIFNALAVAGKINNRYFIHENHTLPLVPADGAKTLTDIYISGTTKTDIEGILLRRLDKKFTTEDYTALSAVPHFRIATSAKCIEISYTRHNSPGKENKKFPKKNDTALTAEDFAAARKSLGEWLALNAPEHIAQIKSAPGKPVP